MFEKPAVHFYDGVPYMGCNLSLALYDILFLALDKSQCSIMSLVVVFYDLV